MALLRVSNVRLVSFRFIRAFGTVHDERSAKNEVMSITYCEHGNPTNVLRMESAERQPLKPGEVRVRMLAAPINPADINMIQGVYPIKPTLPAVGGNEGVGEVVEVYGSDCKLVPGDWVVPAFSGWGTWRTEAICPPSDLIQIHSDIPVVSAATMSVNPCTAYRMLRDFEKLKPGDVVIQNGGNSGVGQAVIQIAAELGYQTVSVVRNRPNISELVQQLKEIGATHVVTDEFMKSKDMKEFMLSLPKPKLALNCVSGKSAAELFKYVQDNATMVTYGGMSKQPLMVPAGALIFKDVKVRGFWMTAWNEKNKDSSSKSSMWDFLCNLVRQNKLRPPLCKVVNIENFEDAIAKAMEPFTSEKQIISFPE